LHLQRDLDLSEGAALTSIGPLSACTQLTRLVLSGCRQLKSLKPLTEFVQLNRLSLYGCSALRDLRPLASCRRLSTLVLDFSGISDLNPVGSCTRLTQLSFSGCGHPELGIPVSSLEALSSCLNLRSLDLSETEVDDLSPLSALTRLVGRLPARLPAPSARLVRG
jgi:internalin A